MNSPFPQWLMIYYCPCLFWYSHYFLIFQYYVSGVPFAPHVQVTLSVHLFCSVLCPLPLDVRITQVQPLIFWKIWIITHKWTYLLWAWHCVFLRLLLLPMNLRDYLATLSSKERPKALNAELRFLFTKWSTFETSVHHVFSPNHGNWQA